MMKVTFIVITLCKGGAQRMLAELANGLALKGHCVRFLMPPEGVIEYPLHIAEVVRSKQSIITEQDIPHSDIIVSNFYTTVGPAQNASMLGKGKHVRLSLCYEPTFLPDSHVSFPTYHLSKNLVVLSKWQQQIIELNHGITGEIVPVGVSNEFYNMGIRQMNKKLQISAIIRRPEGGYSWHREQEYLIEMLDRVKAQHPSVQINLICPPNEYISSPQLKQLSRMNKYRFLTPKDDAQLNYYLNLTDIFASSSTFDTASLPGLEAMKCGAALVTTYAGGNTDYCVHEKNCLISYRHENRLSEDIIQLIQDVELRKKLANEGENEAKKWTWEKSVNLFEQAMLHFADE